MRKCLIGDYLYNKMTRRLIHTLSHLDLIFVLAKLGIANSNQHNASSSSSYHHQTNILDLVTIIFSIIYLTDAFLQKYVNG